ncbi:hypothetical protein ES332_D08G257000v1 [Gossypium tomentosum]|uniref:Uncharacterized protein n=1 Tax=Gossypium tomentosum TaxID=34277 RepID=A0A5D2JYJ6_GOSTO|nr:hypothetical protein ES332_D08G257000v1 [Gossypium tomentosum]
MYMVHEVLDNLPEKELPPILLRLLWIPPNPRFSPISIYFCAIAAGESIWIAILRCGGKTLITPVSFSSSISSVIKQIYLISGFKLVTLPELQLSSDFD